MSVRVKIDHDKVMKRVDKAKWKTILALKSQIAKDTNANVPKRDSFLRNSVFRSTSKKDNFLKWGGFAVLYAHFQWKGKVMVGKKSGSPWAKRGETKIYTSRNLSYGTGRSDWFEVTKKVKDSSWIRFAKRVFRKEF